jgi:hypothetical protein
VASSVNVEFRALAPRPENRGAGGRGLLGLPPYLDEGVPGLGAPLRSTGSNCASGGGLPRSEDTREGDHDRVGDVRPLGEYGLYDASGWCITGALSMMDDARECAETTEGW